MRRPNRIATAPGTRVTADVRRRTPGAVPLEALETRTLFSGSGAAFDYISDLTALSSTNGWGPVGIDRSNGEDSATDGRQIKINGVRYKKGLGVHANSEIHYRLGGKYRNFISDVGVDDEVGVHGSARFQVWADGQVLFDSGTLTGLDRARRVNVDVTGMNELALVVSDAGDGSTLDHADWAGARLVMPFGSAPVLTMPEAFNLREPNGSIVATGRFTDDGEGPWTGTVDYGDGSSLQRLRIDPDSQTFLLDHVYDSGRSGSYAMTVRISDGSATGLSRAQVDVTNVAPSNVGLIGGDENGILLAKTEIPFEAHGIFSDPGAFGGLEQYAFSIDWGDGSRPQTGTTASRFFSGTHSYSKAGVYTVHTTVTDDGGAVGIGTQQIAVNDPSFTYVSSMKPSNGNTGGAGATPYAVNRSIGGRTMKVNGQRFLRGIGVNAPSELAYTLGGAYERLIGAVGVDDGVGVYGSVLFQVFADGDKIFDSGTMTGRDGAKPINLDVRGVNNLRLVVTDAGDGSTFDHADWASVRLV